MTNASNINADEIVADELYSLLDAVDSEYIADEFGIGVHSDKRDSTNHLQVAICEGVDPSSSLAELEGKTAVDDSFEHIPKSRFSELTNDHDRDYRAIVRFLFELLQTPQLSHQRTIQRKRLKWLTRGVVAADATNLELTRFVVVSDEFVGDDEDIYERDTDGGGVEFHCAARVAANTSIRLIQLSQRAIPTKARSSNFGDDVEVFADLDSVIWTFDRAYTRYLRFCEINHSDHNFVTLLHSNARFEVLKFLEEFEVTISAKEAAQSREPADESTRQVRDERIERAETSEEFCRIVLQTPGGEEIDSLTTLSDSTNFWVN